MHRSRISCRPMFGTTQRLSLTTTERSFQTRDAEMNPTRLVGDSDVGRRAQALGARASERAGDCQAECCRLHHAGKSGLSVCGCSDSTNPTFGVGECKG